MLRRTAKQVLSQDNWVSTEFQTGEEKWKL